MTFLDMLPGAVILGPMTKGCNLPYRRLCVELGARITTSEMAVARRLKQDRRTEFALIRRAPEEPCFGVQLAGNNADEMAWAAALAEQRGASFTDVNLGCPIDHFTRKGLGAALARQPRRVTKIVERMKRAVTIPVTVKIRLGWNEEHRNHVEVARAAVEGGADAVAVHGRTRDARYRRAADWDAVGEVAQAVPVPVIGNGDVLFPHEIEAARQRSGCAAVMTARGALIKPWLFGEAAGGGYLDLDGEQRLAIYRRYVALALEHWGDHDRGRAQVSEFLRWHLGFWCRYVPRRPDGTWPGMQERESPDFARTPLERLLSRSDEPALAWLAERLMQNAPIEADTAPSLSTPSPEPADAPEVQG